MMAATRTLSPLDLRRSLGSILDAASAGERFLIERDHRPLAMLVSVEDGQRLDDSADEIRRRRLAAMDRLDEYRERMERLHPRPPGVPDAVELIRQERSRDDPDGYPEYPEDRDSSVVGAHIADLRRHARRVPGPTAPGLD